MPAVMLLPLLLLLGGGRGCGCLLQGSTLKAVSPVELDEWGPAYREVWDHLATVLNFTLTVRTVETSLPEAGWGLLLEEVQEKRADLSLAPVILLPSTSTDLTLTAPIHSVRFSVLLRGGAGDRVRWSGFLAPFERPLWFALLCCVLVLATALGLSWGLERATPRDRISLQVSEALLCILGSSCLQGHPNPPRGWSARLVHLTWLVVSVVVAAVYSSSVTAYLAVTREERPFSTLDQLLIHPRYTPLTLFGSPEHHVFQESQHPALSRLRASSRSSLPTVVSLQAALSVTCGSNSSLLGAWRSRTPALVISSLWAEPALAAAPCRLTHVPLNDIASPRLWAAFPLSTKLQQEREAINKALLQVQECGALVRHAEQVAVKAQLARETREAVLAERAPRFTVRLRDVMPILVLLGCGGGLSLVLLALERAFCRLQTVRGASSVSLVQ